MSDPIFKILPETNRKQYLKTNGEYTDFLLFFLVKNKLTFHESF